MLWVSLVPGHGKSKTSTADGHEVGSGESFLDAACSVVSSLCPCLFLRHYSMASRPEAGSISPSILVSLYVLGQETYKMQIGMFR